MSQTKKIVLVEYNDGKIIRIFKTRKAGFASNHSTAWVLRATAVTEIRHQLWLRSKGFCELCAAVITESSGHMHEQKHRGQGGEISLENSVFICPSCHQRAHKDRNPHWKNGLDKKS